jgi:hypothetical protein
MDLEVWLNKIRQTRSHAEVFAILDEFRTHEWTDEQCSKIARLYMRMLDNFGPMNHADDSVSDEKSGSSGDKKDSKDSKDSKNSKSSKDSKDGQRKEAVAAAAGATSSGAPAGEKDEIKPVTTGATPVNDGPVWYEKM